MANEETIRDFLAAWSRLYPAQRVDEFCLLPVRQQRGFGGPSPASTSSNPASSCLAGSCTGLRWAAPRTIPRPLCGLACRAHKSRRRST